MVLLGGGWVDWSAKRFVVTTSVFVKEMSVAELGVAPGSETFVIPLFLVKQFVTYDAAHASEETEQEGELEVLAVCLWLCLEPSIWKINLVADHNQGPNPACSFGEGVGVQRKPEPLVVGPLGLALLRQVGVVALGHQLINRCDEVH